MKNTQVIPAEFIAVIFRLYFKPLLNLVTIGNIIFLCLHISKQEHIILYMEHLFIRSRDIAAMRHIMAGAAGKDPIIPL